MMIKLLIADDDQDDIDMFEEAMNTLSYPVKLVSVHDGHEVLEKIKTESPDIVVLGLDLPVKDGYECVGEIRSTTDWNAMPVVIFSSSDYKNRIQDCLKAGANHYLIKPSTYDGLLKITDFIYSVAVQHKQL